MVIVNYAGRLGNNLFQYCFGRIIAEQTGRALKTNPEFFDHQSEFKNIVEVDGKHSTGVAYCFNDSDDKDIDMRSILRTPEDNRILLHGFWQKWDFYKENQDNIKSWLHLPESELFVSPDDVILHFRRDDYLESGSDLSFGYYDKILESNKFRQVYITGDIDKKVMDHFCDYFPEVVDLSPIETIKFIKKFNNIIMSNSTFAWWGAFLSDAKNIWYPEPLTGYWSESQDQRLFIPDRMVRIKEGKEWK